MTTLPLPSRSGSLARLSGIFCEQLEFREFLSVAWRDDAPFDTPEKAASLVRRVCEVSSRAAFDQDAAAADRFHNRIRIPYVNWQLGRPL